MANTGEQGKQPGTAVIVRKMQAKKKHERGKTRIIEQYSTAMVLTLQFVPVRASAACVFERFELFPVI